MDRVISVRNWEGKHDDVADRGGVAAEETWRHVLRCPLGALRWSEGAQALPCLREFRTHETTKVCMIVIAIMCPGADPRAATGAGVRRSQTCNRCRSSKHIVRRMRRVVVSSVGLALSDALSLRTPLRVRGTSRFN